MRFLILLTFFIGAIMYIYGIYEQKYRELRDNVKIEYRFIPRSYYDEQLFASQFESKYSNLFSDDDKKMS
jgi:hypothetical protein